MDKSKENLCHCSSCHKFFRQEDLSYKIKNLYGTFIKEKVCPYCGNLGYTRVNQEKYFDKYDKEIFY